MKLPTKSIVFLAVAVGVLVVAALWRVPPISKSGDGAPSAGATPNPSAVAPSAATVELPTPGTRITMQDRAPSAEVPQMPADTLPDLLIDTMGPLAERGSIEAMRELGRGLHDCATSDSGSDVMIERKFIEALVSTEELMKAAGQDFSADQQAAEARAAIEKTKRVRDACRDIDIVRSRSWADWTERAARAGDERAMRYYIEWARFELHLRVRELWTLDDWVTRRNTAYEFAGRLLAAGDCDMLFIRSDLAPNPSLAYIYGHAALERLRSAAITGPADDLPAHLQALDSSTASLAMAVPGDGLVAASNAARGILDSYCSP